jgi:hypothetical protein
MRIVYVLFFVKGIVYVLNTVITHPTEFFAPSFLLWVNMNVAIIIQNITMMWQRKNMLDAKK